MKTLLMTIALCGALVPAMLTLADEYGCGCQSSCGNSCGHRCPACPKCSCKVCFSAVEQTKEKHHCYNVECKEICVPKITLPCWMDAIPFFKCKDQCCDSCDKCPTKECCDAPRCGYVKVVKVLKKHEYECESCGYKWTIQEPCNACQSGNCGAAGYAPAPCTTGACSSGNCQAPMYLPPTVPEQVPAPPQASYEEPGQALPYYNESQTPQVRQRPVNLQFTP